MERIPFRIRRLVGGRRAGRADGDAVQGRPLSPGRREGSVQGGERGTSPTGRGRVSPFRSVLWGYLRGWVGLWVGPWAVPDGFVGSRGAVDDVPFAWLLWLALSHSLSIGESKLVPSALT